MAKASSQTPEPRREERTTGEGRNPEDSWTWQESGQSLSLKALNLNFTLVPTPCPLSLLGLVSAGHCAVTVPWWALGWGRRSGRSGAQTWEGKSHDGMVGTGGGTATQRMTEPCPDFVHPNLDLATLTLTSSANLLLALRGSSKPLLEGPPDEQQKSRLAGLPPRGMSAAGTEGGERALGAARPPG